MPCYRICRIRNDYNSMVGARKWWENWDLRILLLYILITQLYLLLFGRSRRKKTSPLLMIVNVWLLYLFADLLATIALGKLSKIKVEDNDQMYALRVLWAPMILFYLGGPDTMTAVRLEENQLWVRHLVGLLMQGARTAYALIVTWYKPPPPGLPLSFLAVLLFIPGIIKYGERVWVVRSRSKDYRGPINSVMPTIDQNSASRPKSPNAQLVFQAYSYFQTLMPHKRNAIRLRNSVTWRTSVTEFCQSVRMGRMGSVDAFTLIEIELGLMYDQLFSKIGRIFTVWGSILRLLTFSLLVSVLVLYLKFDKPPGYLEVDHAVTIILLAGAIFLEIGGTVVQLVSDWALVWAWGSQSTWATTTVLFVHEFLISKSQSWCPSFQQKKSQRWSGVIGQFSYQIFCRKYKPPVCNKVWSLLFGREKMLKRFSSEESPVPHLLKDLIIRQLLENSQKAAVVDTSQTSTQEIADVNGLKISTKKQDEGGAALQTATENVANAEKRPTLVLSRGELTLSRYDLERQLKGSIQIEFGRSIVIWHVATEVCYQQDHPKIFGKDKDKLQAVKILSDYMMYLLVICPSTFPFCYEYEKIIPDYVHMKELFDGRAPGTSSRLVNRAQGLVLAMKDNPKRWDIMGGMWVEMLCYAAVKCQWVNHIQGLQNGGEFLTHVWLLLMHFGVARMPEESETTLKDEPDGWGKKVREKSEDQQDDGDDDDDDKANDTGEELTQNGCEGCFF